MTTPRTGWQTRPGTHRRSAGPDLPMARPLVVGALAALIAFGTVGMAIPPLAVNAADAAAPGGRLIVTWRSSLRVAGFGAASTRTASPRRSVVVAAPGTAAAVAASLRANLDVASVVPDSIVRIADWPATGAPNDPMYAASQNDLVVIRAPEAWQVTIGVATTVVAILDTGITASHPDLTGIPLVAPFNEIDKSTNVADGNGHGTHVAGTVAAQANNGIGVAGIAPGVSLMPIKVLDDSGSGYFSGILAGIDYAVAHGASVISMSLGGTLDPASVAAFQPTFDAAAAAGVVIVASAGNSGGTTISYPAAFNHVISVAATNNADAIASFSTRNAFVDIAAPGVSILSTLRTGDYGFMSGTSMAAPHVAAVAALVRSANPGWSATQVETAIEQTAVDLGAAGRDDLFGYGRIDAAAALASGATPVPTPTPTPDPTPTPMATLTVTTGGTGTGTIISTPAAIDCGATCSADFAVSTSVTLRATPATGSSFTGWSGACTSTGTCLVSMTAAKSVTATYTLPVPTVTGLSPTSGGAGTLVTISGTGFTGATAVAFNGTAAPTFTVASSTSVRATVPVGATSGTISVTTAAGTGRSTRTFTVLVPTTLAANVPATAARGARITLSATLKTASGTAISRQAITFIINGTKYSGTTSTSGVVSVRGKAPTRAGTYPVSIRFAGSTTYAASSVTPAPILVVP